MHTCAVLWFNVFVILYNYESKQSAIYLVKYGVPNILVIVRSI